MSKPASRKGVMLISAIVLAIGIWGAPGAAVGGEAAEAASAWNGTKITKVFNFPSGWEASCELDGGSTSCSVPILFGVDVPTPQSRAHVSITVTVTFDYEMGSPGDQADAVLSMSRPGTGRTPMPPGRYPFSSSGSPDTRTIVWAKPFALASGKVYSIEFSISPQLTDGQDSVTVSGSQASVVIEVT